MFNVEEIVSAIGGRILIGDNLTGVYGVSTDTRKISSGDLFIALKGENFDGNLFLKEAEQKGAKALIASKDYRSKEEFEIPIIYVDDCLKALGDLAKFHRLKFELPVVCVTGSNGKTSTKEMLFSILSQNNKTLKTEGNLNNLIGLPMQLLNITKEHEKAVFEIGMNRFGEIDRLAEMAVPKVGVITNIARAHLESLHTLESVRDAKGEIINRISENGFMVFSGDDDYESFYKQKSEERGLQVQTFGFSDHNSLFFEDICFPYDNGTKFSLFYHSEKKEAWIPQFGYHNVLNAVAASTVATCLGVSIEEIVQGLRSSSSLPMRMTVKPIPDYKNSFLIDDSYNANPDSMLSSFDTAIVLKRESKLFVVLGDMSELGELESELHKDLILNLLKISTEKNCVFILVGVLMTEAAEKIKKDFNFVNFEGFEFFEDALSWFYNNFAKGDWVLVKGSRVSRMERFSEEILN
tara:strand:- start:14336 stop:15733 length:1398 start_codon:yes stop_codon:yes gene_type:complete